MVPSLPSRTRSRVRLWVSRARSFPISLRIRSLSWALVLPFLLSQFLLAFFATSADAAVVFQLDQGAPIEISPTSFPAFQGATTTAEANVSPGAVLYIDYCFSINSGGNAQQLLAATWASRPPPFGVYYSETQWTTAGPTQQECHTSTTTLSTALVAGTDYWSGWSINGVYGGTVIDLNSPGDFFQVADSPQPPPDSSTRIVSVTPANGTTVATSTSGTIGATIHVNPSEWVNSGFDWYVQVQVVAQNVFNTQPGASPSLVGKTYRFPISAEGYASFSTTTDISSIGDYTVVTQIRKPTNLSNILGFFGFGSNSGVLAATTTVFTAATSTASDLLFKNYNKQLADFTNSASTTLSLSQCLELSIGGCFSYMFVPDTAVVSQFSGLGADLGRKPPFGYWGLVKDVLATSTASTTPSAYLLGAESVGVWFAAFIFGLGSIIMLSVAVWIFKRLSAWDWHV